MYEALTEQNQLSDFAKQKHQSEKQNSNVQPSAKSDTIEEAGKEVAKEAVLVYMRYIYYTPIIGILFYFFVRMLYPEIFKPLPLPEILVILFENIVIGLKIFLVLVFFILVVNLIENPLEMFKTGVSALYDLIKSVMSK